MTLPLIGSGPPATFSLRPRASVWGIDPSTKRMSVGFVVPVADEPPAVAWETLTLKASENLALRQELAVELLAGWLPVLESRYGRPRAIGLEVPKGFGHTPLESYYVIGVLLAAIGRTWPDMRLINYGPGDWKKTATGSGGLRPAGESKADRRRREKARLMEWARDACGYTGELEDEADAIGVAVATAVRTEKWV